MIGWLSGIVRYVEEDSVLLDVGGVGYQVSVGAAMAASLEVGVKAELRIHTHVREDVLALYGFSGERELAAFRLLLSVKGVGPKLAGAIVGVLPVDELRAAIEAEDVRTLTRVSGVGKRLAQLMCVELQGKLTKIFGPPPADPTGGAQPPRESMGPEDRALVRALTGMGFRETNAERAVAAARERHPDSDFEQLLREALQEARR